ncbi:MAG: hypothetical protein IJ060_00525 [Oscillospiraceae bacterium]|nr:hypothetical protein [Oscillospiraceae bacterium]
MGIFGSKKKAKVEQEAVAPQELTPKQMIAAEQVKMAGARTALDQLVEELGALQQPAFEAQMMKAAQQNEETFDFNMQILDRVRETTPSEAYVTENRLALEDGLYILPPELQGYRTMIRAVTGAYTVNMSAAEACAVGADEIDPLILPFVRKLKEALNDGQKLKADVCYEVLKYAVLVVHKRPIEGKSEDTARKIIELRKDTVENVFWPAIRAADQIYAGVSSLSVAEKAYEKRRHEFEEHRDRLNAIPEKYQQQFDVIGFAGAEKLPSNHPLRKFIGIEIDARRAIAKVELQQLYIERLTEMITRLRSELETFRQDAEMRYATEQGMDYSEEENQQALRRITERAVNEINAMFRAENESYKMTQRLDSLVHAAAANQEWLDNAENARERRKLFEEADKAFADFNKMYTEQRNKPPKQENEPQINEQPEEENHILADMG